MRVNRWRDRAAVHVHRMARTSQSLVAEKSYRIFHHLRTLRESIVAESEKKPKDPTSDAKEAEKPQQPPQPQQPRAEIDDTKSVTCYANFCRVTGTPSELIVDFGLNSQPIGTQAEAIQVSQRIVVNFFTAKRMLHALHLAVQRHEQAFGVLETDVQKRVIGRPGKSS